MAELQPPRIDPDAIYDDGTLVLTLRVTHSALARARRSGQLRFTRTGKRTLYRGRWIVEWLEASASGKAVPHV